MAETLLSLVEAAWKLKGLVDTNKDLKKRFPQLVMHVSQLKDAAKLGKWLDLVGSAETRSLQELLNEGTWLVEDFNKGKKKLRSRVWKFFTADDVLEDLSALQAALHRAVGTLTWVSLMKSHEIVLSKLRMLELDATAVSAAGGEGKAGTGAGSGAEGGGASGEKGKAHSTKMDDIE